MRAEFISQFTKDSSVVQATLERYPELDKAASEMCHAFGLRVDASPTHPTTIPQIKFVTPGGFYAGVLEIKRQYGGPNSGEYFYYSNPLVSKERASSRSDKCARDAKKITGIINAVRKNNEEPTVEALARVWHLSMRYAFISINETRDSQNPRFDLSGEAILALLKMFIDNDKVTVEGHRQKLEGEYDKYYKKLATVKDRKAAFDRFCLGATAVGVVPDVVRGEGRIYVLADAAFDEKTGTVKSTNHRRYDSLADSPIAADAAMIRTYMQSHPHGTDDNELGITARDEYYEDLDVSIGYLSGNSGTWLLIPKQHD